MRKPLRDITPDRVAELLKFIPMLNNPDTCLDPIWKSSEPDRDGVMTLPYATYPEVVVALYECAGQPWWMDGSYTPSDAGELVRSDEAIASASLAQIKTMLTFCVRGERFCEGHWGAMISEGRIGLILKRLEQISTSIMARIK